MKISSPPTHLINLSDQIYCFELSSNEWSQNLEESENDSFEWVELKQLYHETRCDAISFAPETSLSVLPKVVTFCAAGADHCLRIFRSDLQSNDTIQLLKGHTNYINDVSWEPEGEYLASVSDDHTCIIWNAKENFESSTNFCLTSAGMSVKWHPEEPGKVLVAEKNGIIHLYNAKTQQVIMSLESPKIPVMSVDWAPSNRLYVAAMAAGDVIIWDLRKSSRPLETRSIHEDGGRVVKFSPNNEVLTASIGRPDITLKVLNSKSQLPQIQAPLKLYGGLCWHYRLPYIAAAFDRKLCFWKVQLK